MVKHTQTLRRLFLPANCLSVIDHFVGLALKGLSINQIGISSCGIRKYKQDDNIFSFGQRICGIVQSGKMLFLREVVSA